MVRSGTNLGICVDSIPLGIIHEPQRGEVSYRVSISRDILTWLDSSTIPLTATPRIKRVIRQLFYDPITNNVRQEVIEPIAGMGANLIAPVVDKPGLLLGSGVEKLGEGISLVPELASNLMDRPWLRFGRARSPLAQPFYDLSQGIKSSGEFLNKNIIQAPGKLARTGLEKYAQAKAGSLLEGPKATLNADKLKPQLHALYTVEAGREMLAQERVAQAIGRRQSQPQCILNCCDIFFHLSSLF